MRMGGTIVLGYLGLTWRCIGGRGASNLLCSLEAPDGDSPDGCGGLLTHVGEMSANVIVAQMKDKNLITLNRDTKWKKFSIH